MLKGEVTQVDGPVRLEPVRMPLPEHQKVSLRRFDLGDLQTHGEWLVARLREVYSYLPPKEIAGWIRGILESNEHMFLRNENSVGCAQLTRTQFALKPSVRVNFVLARDFGNGAHVAEAALFYHEFKRWADNVGAGEIVLGILNDISREDIRKIIGARIFSREEWFAKLGEK